MKFGGSLPRNARFEAATCLLSILWFSFAVAVSMGEAAKHLLFEGVEVGWNVSFCVAGVALPDTRTCLHCRKSFCVTARRCGTLEISIVIWRARRCRVACLLRIALSGLRRVVTMCKFRGRRGTL